MRATESNIKELYTMCLKAHLTVEQTFEQFNDVFNFKRKDIEDLLVAYSLRIETHNLQLLTS